MLSSAVSHVLIVLAHCRPASVTPYKSSMASLNIRRRLSYPFGGLAKSSLVIRPLQRFAA